MRIRAHKNEVKGVLPDTLRACEDYPDIHSISILGPQREEKDRITTTFEGNPNKENTHELGKLLLWTETTFDVAKRKCNSHSSQITQTMHSSAVKETLHLSYGEKLEP